MNYTTSDAYVTHGGTGHRMHQDTAPITTVASAKDLNMVIWSLMKLLADAGISAATFDPDDPDTYDRVSLAVQALAGAGIEQGSFTPTLSFGGASTGMTYASQRGRYTRIGDKVDFWLFLRLSAKGSATGDATVSLGTLPEVDFNTPATTEGNAMAASGIPYAFLVGGSNQAEVRYFDSAGAVVDSVSDAGFTDDSSLYITGSYLVAP